MAATAILAIFLIATATTSAHRQVDDQNQDSYKDDQALNAAPDNVPNTSQYYGNENVLSRPAYAPRHERPVPTSYASVDRDFGYQRNSYGVNINHQTGSPIHGCRIPNGFPPYPSDTYGYAPLNGRLGYTPNNNGYGYVINHGDYYLKQAQYPNRYPVFVDRVGGDIGAIRHPYNPYYGYPENYQPPPNAFLQPNYPEFIPIPSRMFRHHPFRMFGWA